MVKNSKHDRPAGAAAPTVGPRPAAGDGAAAPAGSVEAEEVAAGPAGVFEEIDLADGEPADGEGLPAGESFGDEAAFDDFYAGRDAAPAPASLGVISGEPSTRPVAPQSHAAPAKKGRKGAKGKGSSGVGRHARSGDTLDTAKSTDDIPEYMRKSRRMRRILIVAIVLLVAVFGALCYFGTQLYQEMNSTAVQQTLASENTPQTKEIASEEASDAASSATAKVTTVPDLVSLLGLTQDEAVRVLQHGAQVSSTRGVNEEGNPIKTEARVALTAEPADSRTGTPTVYLGLDEAGAVVQAGYSASTSSLGYGSLSFSDAVRNEDIIQKTLAEAGVSVADDAVELPEDSASYTTFDSDGKTVTKEYCSFSGEAEVDGASRTWSAVLSYDYSMANASGNLADTVRTIFVYVNS